MERDKIRIRTGVQWSELNRLPYCKPAMHTSLGIMHTWLEGVLQEHFCNWWGFQDVLQEKRKRNIALTRRAVRPRMEGDWESNKVRMESDDEMDSSQDSFLLGQGIAGGFFTQEKIEMFREIMKDVVLPSGVGALPQNLGKSKHGQWKASDWLTLFTLILPLIIPKIFIEEIEDIPLNSKRGIFLQNTGDVIQCTQIVCSWSVKEGYAGRFKIAYNRYLKNAKTLYNNPKLKPNHHYCLHIPQQMKIWGPMLGISEFSGERVIGLLQKIPTNNKTSKSISFFWT
ncbi:hypothetical protein O181_022523 [Austropuccinia psidii MF-1]|uniref:Uncharacterized protein n=1 Tax=Austropuccinia psidii MF-1 TaxID=1389203 RepID=A0A9Q3CFC3_9BASI|nr:hypothetical protein [Austropuccinia psidii MF-1]